MKSRLRLGLRRLIDESRWVGELTSFTLRGLFHRVPRTQNSRSRGVLLIPGFSAGDLSLRLLAARLRVLGHVTFGSGIWCNLGCPGHTVPRLEKVLRKANHKTRAKVVVIGHSLGGLYARELACRFPDLVERIILLGSPVHDPLGSTNQILRPIFELWHRQCAKTLAAAPSGAEPELSRDPPAVPETLIYSKTDGVVEWQNCIECGAEVEAVEVPSSHCGLPFSSEVFEIIRDRLARRVPARTCGAKPLKPGSFDLSRPSLTSIRGLSWREPDSREV